jgi:hypothetical protein
MMARRAYAVSAESVARSATLNSHSKPSSLDLTATQPVYRGGRTEAQVRQAIDTVEAARAHTLAVEEAPRFTGESRCPRQKWIPAFEAVRKSCGRNSSSPRKRGPSGKRTEIPGFPVSRERRAQGAKVGYAELDYSRLRESEEGRRLTQLNGSEHWPPPVLPTRRA